MSRDSPKKRHQNHYILNKTLQKQNKNITRGKKRNEGPTFFSGLGNPRQNMLLDCIM